MDLTKLLRLHDADRVQQRHTPSAFVIGVVKKYGEDSGGQLAALITYYGFVSLFPLLLVFVSVLGFVLQGDPSLRVRVEEGTLGQFPLISGQLEHSLSGSGVALGIGTVFTLLGGLAITNVTQVAFDRMWSVPYTERPNFLIRRLRGLRVLLILGGLMIVSSVAGGFVGASDKGADVWQIGAGVIVALIVDFALFLTAFKLLTATTLNWRELAPGAAIAAALWMLLQYFGGLYLSHELRHLGPLYGTFALVLGLLAWLYLGAELMLLAAEVNVVLHRRLWPRSFFAPGLLDADRRALRAVATAEDRSPEERVEVSFEPGEQERETSAERGQ